MKTGNQTEGEMVMSQVLYLSILLEWSVQTLERQSEWLNKIVKHQLTLHFSKKKLKQKYIAD